MLLTNTEIDLLEYVIQGKSNLEISEIIGYSESSVKKMLSKIYKKFNVKNRLALINKLLRDHNLSLFC